MSIHDKIKTLCKQARKELAYIELLENLTDVESGRTELDKHRRKFRELKLQIRELYRIAREERKRLANLEDEEKEESKEDKTCFYFMLLMLSNCSPMLKYVILFECPLLYFIYQRKQQKQKQLDKDKPTFKK